VGIETVISVIEGLIEVVDAEQNLICRPGREGRIQDQSVVVHVDGSFLEIEGKIRARRPQRRTGAQGGGLTPLSAETASRETVLLGKVMVQLNNAIVTIASGGDRTEEVAELCGEIYDRTSPGSRPEASPSARAR